MGPKSTLDTVFNAEDRVKAVVVRQATGCNRRVGNSPASFITLGDRECFARIQGHRTLNSRGIVA